MVKNLIDLSEKIFLAGAKGMAGSAINRALLANGYGQKKNGGKILNPSREKLNLLNYEELKTWFRKNKPTIVIIAAAKVGGILANDTKPAQFILENLKIQSNIIELAWLNGVKRLLFLGSSCIYPRNAPQPIEEESLLCGPLEQTNEPYAIAKISGIKLCEALNKQYGLDAISLMPTNLYGAGDNYNFKTSHVMAAMIRRFSEAKKNRLSSVTCWGSGNPLREFMHVDDLGEAVIFCLERWDPTSKKAPKDKNGNKIFFLNVGTGKDLSIKELAEKVSEIYNFKGEILWDNTKPDGTPRKLLDISKIKSMGWGPKIKLEEGLQKTISEYEENYKINK